MSCPVTIELGAYILGADGSADRSRIHTHLAGCPTCQHELLELASLPGLLARVDPADISDSDSTETPAPPPAPPVRHTTDGAHWPDRRRTRRRLLTTAACVVIAGATTAGLTLTNSPTPAHTTVLTGTDPTSGLRATARLNTTQWGTAIALQLNDLPRNAWCQLIVHARDGHHEISGSWSTTAYSQTATLPAATSIKLADITSLAVLTTNGRQLINLPEHH